MPCEYFCQRRVEFADTDTAGMLHFSMYGRYAEEAEHAFLQSLGFTPFWREPSGTFVGFPRLAIRSQFRRPAAFHDVLDIHLWISHIGARAMEVSIRFSCAGEETARLCVNVACCKGHPDGRLEPQPLPAGLREVLEVAPHPPLEFRQRRPGAAKQAAP